MKITCQGETLRVSEIGELVTATSTSFQSALHAALPEGVKQIDIDLGQTECMDCGGLGALVALRKGACGRAGGVTVRLLNPTQPVRRMFDLLQIDRAFPIETR